jgi:hypothetical protein
VQVPSTTPLTVQKRRCTLFATMAKDQVRLDLKAN